MMVMSWLAPVLIVASVLLLGRSFYILYVKGRGTRATAVITWLSALFVVGYWTWQLAGAMQSKFDPPHPQTLLPDGRGEKSH
jgi:hypothetical protein